MKDLPTNPVWSPVPIDSPPSYKSQSRFVRSHSYQTKVLRTFPSLKKPPSIITMSEISGLNGYLDVDNATLRAPQVGIANSAPQHILSVGSNLYVSGDSSDVLTVDGNVVCEGVKVGLIEITPSYDLEAVANVGNSTSNTIQFTNPGTGIVTTGNVTVGKTLTVEGFRITAQAASVDTLDSITTDDPAEGKTNSGVTDNPIHLTNATDSTGPYTGALQIGTNTGNYGGLGVAGNVHVGRGVYTQDFSVDNVVSNLAVNTDDLFVDIVNSRVGIGKTEPTVALDVVGDVTASGALTVGSNVAVNTDDLFVDTVNSRVGIGKTEPTVALDVVGDVAISSNLTAASSKFSLDTNGTLKQFGAGSNNNYIKLMKYFGSASNWKIATGSYTGNSYQWLSIRAKMTRLDVDVKTIQFNYYGTGGISRVRDSIVIGGGGSATQPNEIKVYNKESNSTYEIYLQIDSATSVEVEITHRNSTIDDDYSTVATANNGAIDETGLTKIYDSGTTTDLRLRSGNVGIGTTDPLSELDIYNPAGTELIVCRNAGSSVNPSIRLWNFDDNNYNNHNIGTPIGTINFSGNERFPSDTHTDNSRAFSYANTLYDWARISALYVGSSYSATTSQGYVRGDLAFYTNNGDATTSDLQERMRIKHNGNVGIGLTNPGGKLHVFRDSSALGESADEDTHLKVQGAGQLTIERKNGSSLMAKLYSNMSSNRPKWIYYNSSSSYWQVGQSATDITGSHDNDFKFFYATTMKAYIDASDGTVEINFTGQHRTFIDGVPTSKSGDFVGLVVSANKNKYMKMSKGVEMGSNAITINESLPLVSLSTIAHDKACFGVISDAEDSEIRKDSFGSLVTVSNKEKGDTRVYINSVGEGAIWVTNINGSLESGDYITTSNVVGYGQKQDSEFLANYTVAKITMDCDFDPVTQPVQIIRKELGDVNYWVNTTYENVSEEEYSNLTEENRQIVDGVYQKITKEESKTEQEGWELEIRQELVNVLDEHGQIQWEDDPSGATEKAYKIRYLDADGNITDEANHVYKAAFVGCTYHCG
jgi:hypothetical protein